MDSIYYRPEDTANSNERNYMWLVTLQHQIFIFFMTLILFLNGPLFLGLMIPGFNWIIYGIGIAGNAITQLLQYVIFTFFITFGWATWAGIIPFILLPFIAWVFIQWYG